MSTDDLLEDVRAFTADVQASTAQSRARRAAACAERREADDAAAAARRAGDHGRDWQRVQQDVDLRRTTIDDVMNGVDPSPHARAVRAAAAGHLLDGRRAWVALDDDSTADPQVQAQMRAAQRARQELLVGLAAAATSVAPRPAAGAERSRHP